MTTRYQRTSTKEFRAKIAKNRKAPLLVLDRFAAFAVLGGLCAKLLLARLFLYSALATDSAG